MKLTSFASVLGLVIGASSSVACSAGDVAEPGDFRRPDVSSAPNAPEPPSSSSSSGSSSGSQPGESSASEQLAAGESKFSGTCARCHGAGGEGRSAPRLVGLGSGALASFSTAEQVATFVSNNMPVSSKTEAYAVVAFLLQKNGVANDRVLDATVASAIKLH